jgi:hypothetical protein
MSVRAFARVRVYLAEACVLSGKKDGGGGANSTADLIRSSTSQIDRGCMRQLLGNKQGGISAQAAHITRVYGEQERGCLS